MTNFNSEPLSNSDSGAGPRSDSGPESRSEPGPRSEPEPKPKNDPLSAEIGAKAARKLKAQRSGTPGVWFGLGMTGLIGWSVVVPTLLGTAFGVWLDSKYPGVHSWTLMGLAIGILVGCLNAWHWVQAEDQAMHENSESSKASKSGGFQAKEDGSAVSDSSAGADSERGPR